MCYLDQPLSLGKTPEETHRHCAQPLAERQYLCSSIKNDASGELLADDFTKPAQCIEVARRQCAGRFDFNSNHASAAIFENNVHFVPATGSVVIQVRIGVRMPSLLSQLGDDKRLQQMAEEISIVFKAALVIACKIGGEPAIGKLDLRCFDQSFSEVGVPRRNRSEEKNALE